MGNNTTNERETYATVKDALPLHIKITTSSDAQLDGPNEVRITAYHPDAPRSYRKIHIEEIAENHYEANADKALFVERPILKIKSYYIVDSNQFPNKKIIMEKTEVTYTLLGNTGNKKDFESIFETNPKEYDPGRSNDEIFSVTKRIEIKFQ